MATNQVRGQRSHRVHGSTTNRRGPKPGQGNVTSDGNGPVGADVPRAGGSAQNGIDQAGGQNRFRSQRLDPAESNARHGGTERTGRAEQFPQKDGRGETADELGKNISRNPTPGEIASYRKSQADHGVQVTPLTAPMK